MIRRSLSILLLAALLPAHALASNYTDRPAVRAFIADMQTRHGFDPETLEHALAQARQDEAVLRLIRPPSSPGARSWVRYRARFVEPQRIRQGVQFWREHAATLARARVMYGVPEEIIVSILGVETQYGRNTGNFQLLSALATLAFDYPPRSELFTRELGELFLLARDQQRPPESYFGSYAGAIGYPQFLPSSIRHYAVDFDGNGSIDFDQAPDDAIGSIAHYLAAHGWEAGGTVAVPAQLKPGARPDELVAAGILPVLDASQLRAGGVLPQQGDYIAAPATLVDLETPGKATEYWLGYRNFYAITRYNKSSFYAMSVFQLAEALRAAHARQP